MGADSVGYAPGALISGSKFTMAMSPRISVSCSINCNTVSWRAGVETPQGTRARMSSGIDACPKVCDRVPPSRAIASHTLPPGACAGSLSPRGRWAAAAAREDPDVHAVLAHVATGLVLVAVVHHELEPVGVSGDQGSVADQVVHAPACLGAVALVGRLDAG